MTTILQKIKGGINAAQLTLQRDHWLGFSPFDLFNPITADPFRTLPFALLFSKDKPDQKGFE